MPFSILTPVVLFVTSLTANASYKAELVWPELPSWSQDGLYSPYLLNIDAVMAEEKLSRFEAVELQNQMLDAIAEQKKLAPGGKIDIEKAYKAALASVKAGTYESGWKPVKFKRPGEFVVALDMDETLLVQWHQSGKESHVEGVDIDNAAIDHAGPMVSGPYVKLTPGAEEFLLALQALKREGLCKGIVIFSAKEDPAALDIVSKWVFKDGKTKLTDVVDAVFTRNHLVIGKLPYKAFDPIRKVEEAKSQRVYLPSKDLRIFDENLEHVVIVDDNPARIPAFQLQALKAQPKFCADRYLDAKAEKNAGIQAHYEQALALAAAEIRETAEAAGALGIPFTRSYIPYSYQGERLYRSLLKVTGSVAKARKLTRENEQLLEASFIPAAP